MQALEGTYIDKKCPFTGNVSIRGRILTGVVQKMKMQRTIVIRRDYLHYIRKYNRFEKRHRNMSVHLSPCFRYISNKIILFIKILLISTFMMIITMVYWVLMIIIYLSYKIIFKEELVINLSLIFMNFMLYFRDVEIGDVVTIGECRPLSKTVRFNVLKVSKGTGSKKSFKKF